MSEPLDQWAEWLLRTRWQGLTEAEAAAYRETLERTRDRVLDGAAVAAGETVVDVGAGTGLLTFGANERVGEGGRVVAVDVSVDALYELLRPAQPLGVPGIALQIGNAEVLPLPDDVADVVTTRSVLIYVGDKAGAAGEFFRVLRPGGRISLFEPVNRRNPLLVELVDFGELAPRVAAWEEGRRAEPDPMLDFDESDLERAFAGVGFADVTLEVGVWEAEAPAERFLTMQGAPGRRALLDEWRASFEPEEAERLAAAVREAGTVAVRWPYVYLAARKP